MDSMKAAEIECADAEVSLSGFETAVESTIPAECNCTVFTRFSIGGVR